MKKLFPYIALALALAQLLLILTSWVWSAAMPLSGVRSMLSSEGIRWYLGHFAELMASPFLVWLLLGAMAYGAVVRCRSLQGNSYRSSRARLISMVFLVIYVGVVLLLTVSPHAVLLSATGRLFPSPFSRAFVPIVSFGVLLLSVAYGWASGSFRSIASIVSAMSSGIAAAAPLFILYVVFVQFYESLCFVFF